MKRILYMLLGMTLLLTACFEDEGNYDYQELNPPHWMEDYVNNPKTFVGRAGGKITFKGSEMFVWDHDPEARAKQFRYEWKFNEKVISEELDFDIQVEELMEKSGIKEYNASGTYVGTFNVIDKNTDVTFIARLQLWLYPFYAPYDWFILADDGGKTNLASMRVRSETVDGADVYQYHLMDYAYEHHNNGASLPGKPLSMSWSLSPHVASQGSVTVITDQGAYEMKGDDLLYYGDLKDQFLDGTPADFQPIARADIDRNGHDVPPCTFLVNKDGKVYTRIMSANYLGGKFLSEPYELDSKGYEIDYFGHACFGASLPAYDRKNRRIVMSCAWRQDINHGGGLENQTSVYRVNMMPIKENQNLSLPLYGFMEGANIINVTASKHITYGVTGTNMLYTQFYTHPFMPGHTIVSDFLVDNRYLTASTPYNVSYTTFYFQPELTKENQILVSANNRRDATSMNAKYRTYISMGKKLFYFDRSRTPMDASMTSGYFPSTDYEFPSKITCLSYDFYACDRLLVGCENGDVFVFDITQIRNPKLEYQGKVKGKVLSFKQVGLRTASHDNF